MNGFKLVGNIDEICNYLNNELKGNVGLPIDNYMHEKQMKKIILDDFYKSKSLKENENKKLSIKQNQSLSCQVAENKLKGENPFCKSLFYIVQHSRGRATTLPFCKRRTEMNYKELTDEELLKAIEFCIKKEECGKDCRLFNVQGCMWKCLIKAFN